MLSVNLILSDLDKKMYAHYSCYGAFCNAAVMTVDLLHQIKHFLIPLDLSHMTIRKRAREGDWTNLSVTFR